VLDVEVWIDALRSEQADLLPRKFDGYKICVYLLLEAQQVCE
jgi:hypothetical protein